jgi:alpha-glucosidase
MQTLTTPGNVQSAWWNNAVVYQLYVQSFADSDGDGWGDLGGALDRLPYLSSLGVHAIWLSPCYPSPQWDHGYDVADYFNINPTYGNLELFDRFVAAARKFDIRILMDIVPNHCSIEHERFVEAVAAGRGSAARDMFWFRDGTGAVGELPPNNWTSIFSGSAWTQVTEPDGSPGQWYLHTFAPQQPDWNWENPAVVQHFDDILTFWFDRGVDGFRVDAVTVVGKHPDLPSMPPPKEGIVASELWWDNPFSLYWPSGFDHWRHWRDVIDAYQASHPGRELVTVSEAYCQGRPEVFRQYLDKAFHTSFAFELTLAAWHGPTWRASITDALDANSDVGALPVWTLNNHDNHRIVTRLGRSSATDPSMSTNNNLVYIDGPVNVEIGEIRAQAAIAAVATLPGALYLYQGEELGLTESLDMPDAARQDPIFIRTKGSEKGRDGCRVPLPWTNDATTNYGFSSANPAAPWLPQPDGWGELAVSEQSGRPLSMLTFYRALLAQREKISGPFTWLDTLDPRLVAWTRGSTTVVLNQTGEVIVLPQGLGSVVFATGPLGLSGDASAIPPDTCLWLRP